MYERNAELEFNLATDLNLPKSSKLLHNQMAQSPTLTKHLPQELKLLLLTISQDPRRRLGIVQLLDTAPRSSLLRSRLPSFLLILLRDRQRWQHKVGLLNRGAPQQLHLAPDVPVPLHLHLHALKLGAFLLFVFERVQEPGQIGSPWFQHFVAYPRPKAWNQKVLYHYRLQ